MCAMLEIERNARLKELGWRLLLQVEIAFMLSLVNTKLFSSPKKKTVLSWYLY